MKILMVDDDGTQRESLKIAFCRQLHVSAQDILEAKNAIEASKAMEEHDDIDVVVLDQRLGSGQENGISFLRRMTVRADRPRVMVLTSHPIDIANDDITAADKPVDFFLEKGVPDTLICQAVRMMALGRQGVLRYGEEDVFGAVFCKELDELCRDLDAEVSLPPKTRAMVKLVRSCARTFMIARGRCSEDLFQYVITFNEAACTVAELPQGFVDLLHKFPDVERALYRLPAYRDHVIHQMQVFLLGFCILAHMRRGMPLDDPVRSRLGLDDGTWIRRWFLTSAFHDVGYPFEKMGEWLNSFFTDMLSREAARDTEMKIPCTFDWGAILARDNHLDNFSLLVSRLARDLRASDRQSAAIKKDLIRRVVEQPDHAVMSALIVLGLAGDEDITDEAVAVCLHGIGAAQCVRKSLERHLAFKQVPLAFLLAFCDLVQEWGRVNPMTLPNRGPDFGNPRFHSIRYENGINLELVYAQQYPEQLQDKWHECVFNGILAKAKHCWSSGLHAQFHVSYEWQSQNGESNLLGTLDI